MQQLGKYVLTRQIGVGGMGVVFEGHDPHLNRHVAVKLLPAAKSPEADVRRFQREAQAAAAIAHPNCVAIYEIGEDEGRPFIVMELVRGHNAGQLVEASGPLPWIAATRILIAACRGMTAVHAAGLIHRDVKPSNLLVSETGVVKLADFGLAKAIGHATLSLTGDRTVGTPHYMSPEQCWNEALDGRADVYALGATYYALLTGRPPFVADRDLQVMFAHCNNPVPDPRGLRPELPDGCVEVVVKSMAKSPAERYQTAAEMQAALESVLALADTTRAGEKDTLTDLPRVERPVVTADTRAGSTPTRVDAVAVFAPTMTRRRALLAIPPAAAALGVGAWLGFRKWGDAEQHAPPGQGPGPGEGAGAQPPVGEKPPRFADGTVWKINGSVGALALSEDARRLAVALSGTTPDDGGGGVKLYDCHKGPSEPLWRKWEGLDCHGVTFSPDGKFLVVASENGDRVIVWSFAEKREPDWEGLDCKGPVGAVAFSPDGKLFAAALNWWKTPQDAPLVRVWKVANGKGTVHKDVQSGSGPVKQLSFSPDGKFLAIAIGPGYGMTTLKRLRCVDVRDVETGEFNYVLAPGTEMGPSAAFARNVWLLAVARADTLGVFTSPELKNDGPLINPRAEARCLAVTPDGKTLAAALGDGIHVYDTKTGAMRGQPLDRHTGQIFALAFTPDGKTLISGSMDQTVRFWDVPGS